MGRGCTSVCQMPISSHRTKRASSNAACEKKEGITLSMHAFYIRGLPLTVIHKGRMYWHIRLSFITFTSSSDTILLSVALAPIAQLYPKRMDPANRWRTVVMELPIQPK